MKKKYISLFIFLFIFCSTIFAENLNIYNEGNKLLGTLNSQLVNNAIYFSINKIKKIIGEVECNKNYFSNDIDLKISNNNFSLNFLNNIFIDKGKNKIYEMEGEFKLFQGDVLISKQFLLSIFKTIYHFTFSENNIVLKSEISNQAAGEEKPLPVETKNQDTGLQESSHLLDDDIFSSIIKSKKDAGAKINIIVIDAGHGGQDAGAVGLKNLKEKDVTLAVALKLKKILQSLNPALKIYLTRDSDKFIPLLKRTELANKLDADLFISIHCNSSYNRKKTARGFETYYYYFKSDEATKLIEKVENGVMEKYESGLDINQTYIDLIKKDMIQIQFINESRNLAIEIQKYLDNILKTDNNYSVINRGVKKANFSVLQNALMPSILIELGFVSNETESLLLSKNEFQEKIAEAIGKAIINYKEEYELR